MRRWIGAMLAMLLLAGGPATFLNPEPIAPFFDAFLIGEGEEMIPEAFADIGLLRVADHEAILEAIAKTEGAYLPEHYEASYDGGNLVGFAPIAGSGRPDQGSPVAASIEPEPVWTTR